jgi:hypothetical protein
MPLRNTLSVPASRIVSSIVAVSALVGICVSGCVVADGFGTRAVQYNLEADDNRNKTLLINVVRAAYRRPLQFSEVSQVLGTATGTLKADFTLPFTGVPSTATRIFSAAPGVSISGGPNFTVTVQNTKEFYQGILSPIQPQTAAYYLHAGFPKTVLLTLLVSRIEYGPKNGPKPVLNSVFNRAEYDQFEDLLLALIKAGLDAEQITDPAVIGPPLFDEQLRDIKTLQNLQSQDIKIVRYDRPKAKADLEKRPDEQRQIFKDHDHYYQLETRKSAYRFCFNPRQLEIALAALTKDYPDIARFVTMKDEPAALRPGVLCGATSAERKAPWNPKESRVSGEHRPLGVDAKQMVVPQSVGSDVEPNEPEFALSMRSVEGIIYYLGEVVRRELRLDGLDSPFTPTVKTGPKYDRDDTLFEVSRGFAGRPSISVSYDGTDYYVAVDAAGNDRSAQVMEVVIQLLAQNNSAKDLPAPSILPVITR